MKSCWNSFYGRFRHWIYRLRTSRQVTVIGKPVLNQPLLMRGKGQVSFGEQVRLGYSDSPGFWSTYQYFDLRGDNARIHIGSQVILNNNTSLTADNASITIGDRTVAGVDLTIMTSDGHGVDPERRHNENYPCCSVQIGENVFIGDHVIILKGVTIGRDCVIGAGSVVTKSIPERVVAAGNPCRIIRTFN